MHKSDTNFHVKTNRITERFIFRHLQSFPQVFFIISRVENEYQCHFAIDIACSGVTIRFSRYGTVDSFDTYLFIHTWYFLPNFIDVEYGTLGENCLREFSGPDRSSLGVV